MNWKQFYSRILVPTLKRLEPTIPYSLVAEKIVAETIYHESEGLTWIAQVGGGPGLGVAQVEPPTYDWLVNTSYGTLHYREGTRIRDTVFEDLASDLALSVALCRLRYYVVRFKLPSIEDGIKARAVYWGKYYQTTNDPVKIADYLKDADRMNLES